MIIVGLTISVFSGGVISGAYLLYQKIEPDLQLAGIKSWVHQRGDKFNKADRKDNLPNRASEAFFKMAFDKEWACPKGYEQTVYEGLLSMQFTPKRVLRFSQVNSIGKMKLIDSFNRELSIYIETVAKILAIPNCITDEYEIESLIGNIGLISVMADKYPSVHYEENKIVKDAFKIAQEYYPDRTKEQRSRDWAKVF